MGYIALFSLGSTSCGAPLAAQSFTQVVSAVVENHPRLLSAENIASAGQSEVSAARAALRPQLGVTADAGWAEGGQDSRSGAYILPEITASQLVFDGGRAAADIRRSKLRAQTLEVQQDRVVDDVVGALSQSWSEWSRQRNLVEISEAQVAALEQLHWLVSEIASFDRGRGSDVVLVGSRLEQAKSMLDARRIARDDARATIREIASAPVEPLGDLPNLGPRLPAHIAEAVAWVDAVPTVQISDLQVSENDALVVGARSWWQPQINLEVARTSERTSAGDMHLFNAFGVRLRAISLPFGGGGQARLNAARSSATAARFDAAEVRRSLTDRVERLWMLAAQRRDRVPRLAQIVEQSDHARDVVQEQFRIGRRSILDLLSYESERFNARSALANEQHDLVALEYQLMGALGRIDAAVLSFPDRSEARP